MQKGDGSFFVIFTKSAKKGEAAEKVEKKIVSWKNFFLICYFLYYRKEK